MHARKGLALLRACHSGERLHAWPTESLKAEARVRSTIAAAPILFMCARLCHIETSFRFWQIVCVSHVFRFQMMCSPEPVDSVFAKEELVYLSADATDVVTELDPTKVS